MESRPRFMSCHRQERPWRILGRLRAHLGADPGALQAVDDHAVFRLQAFADHAQALVERPEHDRPRLHGVVVLDHEHDLARLIGGDGGIRQQQRLIGRAADQPDAAELSRQDRKVLVRDHRAAAQRAGGDVQPVVEEVHRAFMRGLGFAGQRHLHRIGRVARTRTPAFVPEPVVPLIGRLIHVEIDVDRIERDDRGQQRRAALAALHQIAGTDEMPADPAGDRRQHMGEFDVELGRLQRAVGLRLGGPRRLQGLAALVDDGIRNRLGHVQGQRAIELAFGQFRLGARIGQAGRRPAARPPRTGGHRSHRADRRHGRWRRRETRRW